MSRAATPRRNTPLTPEQQELALGGLELTENIVTSFPKRWGNVLSLDELKATAKAALVEAAQTFDPSQSTAFARYAELRIEGALLDAVRHEYRLRGPALNAVAEGAMCDYLADLLDPPVDDLGDNYNAWREQSEEFSGGLAAAVVASMVAHVLNAQDGSEEAIAARQAYDNVVNALQAAKAELDPKEREVLDIHYSKELGLRDVAEQMNISYSTAKRVHASMLEHLGDKLRRQGFRGIEDTGITD